MYDECLYYLLYVHLCHTNQDNLLKKINERKCDDYSFMRDVQVRRILMMT